MTDSEETPENTESPEGEVKPKRRRKTSSPPRVIRNWGDWRRSVRPE